MNVWSELGIIKSHTFDEQNSSYLRITNQPPHLVKKNPPIIWNRLFSGLAHTIFISLALELKDEINF